MLFCSVDKCNYPNFSIDKVTRLPYCRMHQTKRTDFDRRTIIHKAMDKQKALSTKVRSLQNDPNNLALLEEKGIVKNNELELFFLMRMNTCLPICENCHAIKNDLKFELFKSRWKSCQAHLLPKRHFKSIATHPLIAMVLGSGFSGMCYCHDTYDSSWDAASKMPIWNEVCRRFLILYPSINPLEYKFIPDVLSKLLPPSEEIVTGNEINNQQSKGNED